MKTFKQSLTEGRITKRQSYFNHGIYTVENEVIRTGEYETYVCFYKTKDGEMESQELMGSYDGALRFLDVLERLHGKENEK